MQHGIFFHQFTGLLIISIKGIIRHKHLFVLILLIVVHPNNSREYRSLYVLKQHRIVNHKRNGGNGHVGKVKGNEAAVLRSGTSVVWCDVLLYHVTTQKSMPLGEYLCFRLDFSLNAPLGKSHLIRGNPVSLTKYHGLLLDRSRT